MRYFIVLLLLCSCSAASKLRKAEKLIKKAEEMGAKWHVDTVKAKIPVSVPEIRVRDVHHAPIHDTVHVEKDRLKIKYVRLPGDSVFVEGKCEADTIVIQVPVTVTRTIKAQDGFSWWQLIILGLVAVVFGYGVRAFTRN